MIKIRLVSPDLPEDAYVIGFTQEDMDNFAKIFKNVIESEYGEPAKLTKNKVKQYISSFFFNYSIPSEKRDKLDYLCPKKGLIAELIVSKKARSSGIGTQLLKTMEDYFKSIKCEYYQIDVSAYNEGARKFYYKNGYEDRMITVFKKI